MPLMWIMSISMILYIFLMLLIMYFNSVIMMICKVYYFNKMSNISYNVKYMW